MARREGIKLSTPELQADPSLVNSAVEELLRFESPIQLNNRLTTAPLALILNTGTSISGLTDHLLSKLPESESEEGQGEWDEGAL